MMKQLGLGVILSLLVVLASCAQAPQQQAPQATPTVQQAPHIQEPQSPPAPVHVEAPIIQEKQQPQPSAPQAPQVKEFSMTARQFEFDPSTIRVKKSDHVVLHIKSLDVTHGFSLPDFGVNMPLTPGDEKTVEFDANKSGEFEFFCSVVCGSGHGGMRGMLIVEG